MDIRLAIKSKKIADMNLDEVRNSLRVILASTYFLAGIKTPDPVDAKLTIDKLSNDLKTSFRDLTMDEVALCFEMGSKETYGEFMGLNIRTYTKWLKIYKTSDMRYKAIKELNAPALPPPSKEYGRTRLIILSNRYFEGYKEEKEFPGNLAYKIYEFLQNEKIVNHTKEVKWRAVEEAKKRLYNPKKDGMAIDYELLRARIMCEAMSDCLKLFFDELIEMGMNLNDVII